MEISKHSQSYSFKMERHTHIRMFSFLIPHYINGIFEIFFYVNTQLFAKIFYYFVLNTIIEKIINHFNCLCVYVLYTYNIFAYTFASVFHSSFIEYYKRAQREIQSSKRFFLSATMPTAGRGG